MGDPRPTARNLLSAEERRDWTNTPEYHAAYIHMKLMRGVRWGLYSVIYLIYLFLIAVVFVQGTWQWGLLALFFIIAIHPLRYLWDDADKSLWDLRNHAQYDPTIAAPVESYQRKISVVLQVGLYALDLAFVVLTYFVLDTPLWAGGSLLGLVCVEVLHHFIRKKNHDLREAERKTYHGDYLDREFDDPEEPLGEGSDEQSGMETTGE